MTSSAGSAPENEPKLPTLRAESFRIHALRWSSRMLWAGAAGVLAFGLSLVFPWSAALRALLMTVGLLVSPTALILGATRRFSTGPRMGPVELRVEVGGLRLGALRLGPFAQGYVLPEGKVRLLTLDGRTLELQLAGADGGAADRLLEELGLGPGERAARFEWRSARRTAAGVFGALVAASWLMLVLVPAGSPAGLICGGLALTYLAALVGAAVAGSRHLTIARDGLELSAWLGTRRISFSELAEVVPHPLGFELVRRDGARELVRVGLRGEALAAAIHRIERALETSPSMDLRAARELMARGGKSVDEWKAMVAQVLTTAAGFRAASITPAHLEALLDDPTSTIEQRLGAAIAIVASGALTEREREKIRVAGSASSSPRVRVALEALAEGKDDPRALAQALEEEPSAPEDPARSARA